jgi:hypothetical protein
MLTFGLSNCGNSTKKAEETMVSDTAFTNALVQVTHEQFENANCPNNIFDILIFLIREKC